MLRTFISIFFIITFMISPSFASKTKSQPKLEFIKFSANWCPVCRHMEQTTFRSSAVHQALKNYKITVIDTTYHTAKIARIEYRYGVNAYPTYVIMHKGQELSRQSGYVDPQSFVAWLRSYH